MCVCVCEEWATTKNLKRNLAPFFRHLLLFCPWTIISDYLRSLARSYLSLDSPRKSKIPAEIHIECMLVPLLSLSTMLTALFALCFSGSARRSSSLVRLYLSVHPFCVPLEMNAFSSNSATLAHFLSAPQPPHRSHLKWSARGRESAREGECGRTRATIGKCVWCWKMNYAKYHVVMLCVNT